MTIIFDIYYVFENSVFLNSYFSNFLRVFFMILMLQQYTDRILPSEWFYYNFYRLVAVLFYTFLNFCLYPFTHAFGFIF